ncbi:MAG: hypothetical protein JSW52_10485 [Candidatus Coatesbacteria bacterium]|nr:MAG: hypothetical protein JSW52_10485 [Candidatus Coatesbacteria bacterium]
MRYIRLAVVTTAVALFAIGCMDYSQKIVIWEGGSALITQDGWLDPAVKETAGELGIGTGYSEILFLGKYDGNPGVVVGDSYVEIDEEANVEHHHAEFTVESSGCLDDWSFIHNLGEIDWKSDGDELVFEQKLINEPAKDMEPEEAEFTRAMYEGYDYTYAFTVVMPGPVTETNGSLGDDGRTVTWSWPFSDLTVEYELTMTAKCEIR